MKTINLIFDWSEVWALLIPILALLINKNKEQYFRPIIVYVFLAFFINLFADVIADFKKPLGFPEYFQTNSFLYNIHSIVRFSCFSTFFLMLKHPFFPRFKKGIQVLGFVFTIIYFYFENFNNPNHISGDFLAIEAFLLLIYCLFYFHHKLRDDRYKTLLSADFYIVLGLSIYVVVNFFVFLFYIPMIENDPNLANRMWNVHNIAFIIFCIFIAKAFYTHKTLYAV